MFRFIKRLSCKKNNIVKKITKNGYFDKLYGLVYPIIQVSKKVYRAGFPVPEHIFDTLRAVRVHDFVKASCKGQEIELVSFKPSITDWLDEGDIADVLIEMSPDVDIVTKGTGIVTGDSTPPGGGCFVNDYEAKALILQESFFNLIII